MSFLDSKPFVIHTFEDGRTITADSKKDWPSRRRFLWWLLSGK